MLSDPAQPLGFPVAEVAGDGSSVITKHAGTGGVVTVDTVTAQLLYEIQDTDYLNPDVTTDLTSIELAPEGPDRVRVSGVRGSPPPERLKVSVNELGGHRNSVEFLLTGMDIEEKADWVRAQLSPALTASSVTWSLGALPRPDADTEEGASTVLRCTVQDASPEAVGRTFSSAAVELALASYPGFTITAPPGNGTPFGVYRAEYVDRSDVTHTVHHADGRVEVVADACDWSQTQGKQGPQVAFVTNGGGRATRRGPLGTFVHARSGDKGGDANLGLWVRHEDPSGSTTERLYDARVAWLLATVTPGFIRELLPEARDLDVDVHPLPNLGGVNVVLHGLLGKGVAASTRFDPQAKGLGEWARSRHVEIPEVLL
jgi:Acyclic terpene utilisation family protein AtuA